MGNLVGKYLEDLKNGDTEKRFYHRDISKCKLPHDPSYGIFDEDRKNFVIVIETF